MKGKWYLIFLVSFYDKKTQLAEEGKVMDVVYLYLSKIFDITPPSILMEKPSTCGLERLTVH